MRTITGDIQNFKRGVDNFILFLIGFPVILVLSIIKQVIGLKLQRELIGTVHCLPPNNCYALDKYAATNRIRTANEEVRAQNLVLLRNYVYTHDYTLVGITVRTRIPKIEYEDLCRAYFRGDTSTPYMIQEVTFGEELNSIISKAFSMKLKKVRGRKATCLEFKNGETFDFEVTLKSVLYSDKVRVKIIDNID